MIVRAPSGTKLARRRFMLAGAASCIAVAMPQVSRAQTATWRVQSAWAQRDIFHEFAVDYGKKVAGMTGGRLKLEVTFGGMVVPPFQMADAVHTGILDGGHGSAALWYNKHKAYALFGTPPSYGWDSHSFLGWFYYGGGEALYRELVNGLLKLNVFGLLYFPMPTQPLGWFRKEIKSSTDLRGLKYRSAGLSAELFKTLGAAVTALPSGQVVSAMDRDLLDATESNNPSSDMQQGIPNVANIYMMRSHHHQVETFEILFNKTKFDALTPEMKEILRHAAYSASSDQLWSAQARYAKDLDAIKKAGVTVARTGANILEDQLRALDRVLAEQSRESFFAKVVASQKDWVKRTAPYQLTNNLDSEALISAYRHFFGQA